jgi:hypothetical protein
MAQADADPDEDEDVTGIIRDEVEAVPEGAAKIRHPRELAVGTVEQRRKEEDDARGVPRPLAEREEAKRPAAAIPLTRRTLVNRFGVTNVPTSGRTIGRTMRCRIVLWLTFPLSPPLRSRSESNARSYDEFGEIE